MATSLVWPYSVLVPAEVSLNGRPNNTSGGTGLGGSEQVIGNTPGRWLMTFKGVDIRTAAQVLAWNALTAQLQGRLNPLLIPIYDKQRAPSPPALNPRLSATAAPGDTEISIAVDAGSGTLAAGMNFECHFSERLYRIATVNSVTGTVYDCNIWPPWRDPNNAGSILVFDAPYFRVRLAADNGMDMSLELLKFGSPAVNFVEDV